MASQTDETIRLLLQVVGAKDLEDLKAKAAGAKEALRDVAEAADGEAAPAAGAMADAWKGIQDQFGGFVKDLAPAVKGGLQGLVSALSSPTGITVAVYAANAALAVLGPLAADAWAALTAGTESIPESADRLERLNAQLDATNGRLKELRDKQKLTNDELAEYNRLLGERAGLEKAANDAKEDKSSLDALRRKEREAKLDKTAAGDVQAAIGEQGGVDAVLGQLTGQMTGGNAAQAQRDQLARDWEAKLKGKNGELLRLGQLDRDKELAAADKATDAARRADRDRAEAILGGATQGDMADVNRLMEALPGVGQGVRGRRAGRDQAVAMERAVEQSKRNADYFANRQKAADAAAKAFDDEEEKDRKADQILASEQQRVQARYDESIRKQQADEAKARAKADEKAARDAEAQSRANTPAARLAAAKDQAYQTAAGMALDQNNGEFNPSQLDAIARQAANTTQGLDVGSIQDAINRAAFLVREKLQADLARQMGRQQVQSDSYYGSY